MNEIQITAICISVAATALNIVNMAMARMRYKELEAKDKELERQIKNARWDC